MLTKYRRWRLNKFKEELSERIALGIVYLDRINPTWRARVDPRKIDLDSSDCLLGQIYGDCQQAAEKLELFPAELIQYGFELPQRTYRYKPMWTAAANRMWQTYIQRYDEMQNMLSDLDDELE